MHVRKCSEKLIVQRPPQLFDHEDPMMTTKVKRYPKNTTDTNLLEITFDDFPTIAHETTKSYDELTELLPVCPKCSAVLNSYSKIFTPLEYKEFLDKMSEENCKGNPYGFAQEGVTLSDNRVPTPLAEDQAVWICEFCFNHCVIAGKVKKPLKGEVVCISGKERKIGTSPWFLFCIEWTERIGDMEVLLAMLESQCKALLPPKTVLWVVLYNEIEVAIFGDCSRHLFHLSVGVKPAFSPEDYFLQGKEGAKLLSSNEFSWNNFNKHALRIERLPQACLGAAILVSLGLVSEAPEGSQVILFTSGEARSGIGNLGEKPQDLIKFYRETIVNYAKINTNPVSVILVKAKQEIVLGTEFFRLISHTTGGIYHEEDQGVSLAQGMERAFKNRVIAKDVTLTIVLSLSMQLRYPKLDKAKWEEKIPILTTSTKRWYEVQNRDIHTNVIQNKIPMIRILMAYCQAICMYTSVESGSPMTLVSTAKWLTTFETEEGSDIADLKMLGTYLREVMWEMIIDLDYMNMLNMNYYWASFVRSHCIKPETPAPIAKEMKDLVAELDQFEKYCSMKKEMEKAKSLRQEIMDRTIR